MATTTTTRSRRTIYLLTAIAVVFSLGHHLDHVIRGNHVGWPLTDQVTVFTISLGIYPILLAAVLLYRAGRIGAGVWALLSGNGPCSSRASTSARSRWSPRATSLIRTPPCWAGSGSAG
ncbi:hypothetical protein C8D81_0602 [Enemella evansiae]|nr:hypothetical protein C8D81_0602 [Enemella evansiae]